MTTAVMIVNEASGFHLEARERGSNGDAVVRWLAEGGVEAIVLSGPVPQQIAESLDHNTDIVIVDGGDGTISAVIEAHRGRGRPIGIIPGGTMNLLAQDYGVPQDRREAAAVIARGRTRSVDLGVLGKKPFLHTAFTGLPVRIGTHRERRRGRLSVISKAALALHALTTLPRDPKLTLEGESPDGASVTLTSPSFVLVVGALDNDLLPRPHRVSVTGGFLTVFAVHPDSGADLARLLVRGAFSALEADEAVDRATIRSATIRGPRRRLRAMLDGEATLLPSPASVAIEQSGVEIFCVPPA